MQVKGTEQLLLICNYIIPGVRALGRHVKEPRQFGVKPQFAISAPNLQK